MRRNSRSGVTLLELLLSLALMALIAVGLASTLGLGTRVWEQSKRQVGAQEQIVLRTRLRTWLSQSVSPTRLLPFDHQFTATDQEFSFVTLAETPHEPNAAALLVSVKIVEDETVLSLSYLGDSGSSVKSEDRVLYADEAVLAYFDPINLEWVYDWDNAYVLPSLVKIEAVNDSRAWPLFVAETGLL